MSVVLTPPTPQDTRSTIADWLELQTLASSRRRSTAATLRNVLEIAGDEAADIQTVDEITGEILDKFILEEERSEFIAAAFEELGYRQRMLGDAYPFTVDARRLVLERSSDNTITQAGQVVYLFCLLASAIREKKLQPVSSVTATEQSIPDAFQICACLAAGGYVRGEVSSFGFPRASGTAFLPALRDVFDRFGIGRVRKNIPDGLPDSLKDGGIDVIAWRDHPDCMPGKIYLLGQCASGQNWKDKSVVEYIAQLHGTWFTEVPANFSVPAMFIPFTFHRDMSEERRGSFMEAMKNAFWYYEKRFGIIFDRLRIAHFAHHCMVGESSWRDKVDGTERFDQVESWVKDALHQGGLLEAT